MSTMTLLEPTVFVPSGTPLMLLAQIVEAARKGMVRPADEVGSVGRDPETSVVGLSITRLVAA